jgi:hypothetical protein
MCTQIFYKKFRARPMHAFGIKVSALELYHTDTIHAHSAVH